MKILDIGTKNHTEIQVFDTPGIGGAHHNYHIYNISPYQISKKQINFAKILFQNGPINENGINGCHHEDLITIIIHRLQHFQQSEYKCRENEIALTKLEEALMWLKKRTQNNKID